MFLFLRRIQCGNQLEDLKLASSGNLLLSYDCIQFPLELQLTHRPNVAPKRRFGKWDEKKTRETRLRVLETTNKLKIMQLHHYK